MCGMGVKPKYLEADVYYYMNVPHTKRSKRKRVTVPKQEKLNYKNAIRHLNQLLKTNFTDDDYRLDLTYSDDNMPVTLEDAIRMVSNYLKKASLTLP